MDRNEIQGMIDAAIGKLNIPKVEDIANAVRDHVIDTGQRFCIPPAEYQRLTGRAAAISPEAESRMVTMLLTGRDIQAMTGELDEMSRSFTPDAGNMQLGGGADGAGTRGQTSKVEAISDEDFTRMICNVDGMPRFDD